MLTGGGAAGACGAGVERKADVRVTATAPPAATASTAMIVSSLVVLGRLSIAPTQGIVKSSGTAPALPALLAVPPRLLRRVGRRAAETLRRIGHAAA